MSFNDKILLNFFHKNFDTSSLSPGELEDMIKNTKKEIQKRIEAEQKKKFILKEKKLKSVTDNFWKSYDDNMSNTNILWELKKARKLVRTHKNIIIATGSGMSQASGIPTFRGSGKLFSTINKELESAIPHKGYQLLLNYCKDKEYFVLTSNIDCLFKKAGFDENRIVETHGNYNRLQCVKNCSSLTYPSTKDMQKCPECGYDLRPNILTLGDRYWCSEDVKVKEEQMDEWVKEKLEDKILIIEIGCGIYIPVIRDYSELLLEKYPKNISLIRINPDYPSIPKKFLKFRQGNRVSTARLQERCIETLQSILP
jgi:NAD-dependent SIR2 family protein deacetylase